MPSTRRLRDRLVTPENVALVVAAGLAVVGASVVRLRADAAGAGYLGLVALGVSTPTTLTSHDLLGDRFGPAVARVCVACLLTWIAYGWSLTVVGGALDGLVGVAVAFVGTALLVEGVALAVDQDRAGRSG
jgi:hypothetical protein